MVVVLKQEGTVLWMREKPFCLAGVNSLQGFEYLD